MQQQGAKTKICYKSKKYKHSLFFRRRSEALKIKQFRRCCFKCKCNGVYIADAGIDGSSLDATDLAQFHFRAVSQLLLGNMFLFPELFEVPAKLL